MTTSNMVTYQSLSSYIQEGNLRGLSLCLNSHHSQVDVRDENGQTVLMLACQLGDIMFVRELLRHGADVSAMDNDNWTPLLNAAKEGHDEVVAELLECGANVEHKDMGGWTSLAWACYKGKTNAAKLLLEKGADPNVTSQYHVSCLAWAAGRGHRAIVRHLLSHGAKVNVGDKYGTTALVWASRKGFVEIVDELLKAGANVDTAGMYSWTALLVATRGNYFEVVQLLLDYSPNVNVLDSDGCSALTIACKEGFTEIAVSLLNAGAYVNVHDKNGDTNLIHAAKAGHLDVVEALLKKYADIDVQGTDKKTALYWAVEKGHVDITKALLNANPDIEIATKDGDTPLMRATRNRNMEIVQMLLERKAKVSMADKKGDTALHIAMRAHSKAIVELLLRNPKNSQLLYRPNRNGETPYNIDSRHQRSILSQIFGARRLNTNEDNENMLGYDLYSSALADILSEPSLSMPICLGLYAKWGSGKSFLIGKLQDEMRNFAKQWIEPTFEFTWIAFMVVLFVATILGIVSGIVSKIWFVGFAVFGGVILLSYILLAVVRFGSERYDWHYCYEISTYLARKTSSLWLFLQVVFCSPPEKLAIGDATKPQNIKFLFSDQSKSSGASGGASVVQMVSSLFSALEHEYGTLTTRLYTVFRPKPLATNSWKWRRMCCIPYFYLFLGVVFCLIGATVLLGVLFTEPELSHVFNGPASSSEKGSENDNNGSKEGSDDDEDQEEDDEESPASKFFIEQWHLVKACLITVGCIIAAALVANVYTIIRILSAVCYPRKRRVVKLSAVGGVSSHVSTHEGIKMDVQLQTLRANVQLMAEMAKCIDGFTGNQTRLVVIVDGLDSCEQEKVLNNLDAVHLLFSDLGAPFIILLAIDPHVIVKAIEVNIQRVFHDNSISGHNYLRNIVHLPFYLQNTGFRKVRVAQKTALSQRKTVQHPGWSDEVNAALSNRRFSSESSMSIPERVKQLRTNSSKGSKKLRPSDSVASSVGNLGRPSGAHDLTRVLLTDDYFSDVNPRSMRRLMNVMYITGRLLKAFNIDFNWYHLASWVNITEQWPYRTSWIIFYYEKNEETIDDSLSMKSIYDKIRDQIPVSKDVEPLLEIDRDERKFEVFLTFHKASLHVSDLKVFLPFTINLDPYIRKTIREEQQSLEEMSRYDVMGPHHSWISQPGPPPPGPPSTDSRTGTHRRPISAVANKAIGGASSWMFPYPAPTMMVTPPMPSAPPAMWGNGNAVMNQRPGSPIQFGSLERQGPIKQAAPVMLPEGHSLTSLSVYGVCDLVSALEGIPPSYLKKYKETIKESNINGRVLMFCDVDELKKVMKMSFGDWELFRVTLLSLRESNVPFSSIPFELHDNSLTVSNKDNKLEEKQIHVGSTPADRRGSIDENNSNRQITRERSASMKRHATPSPSSIKKQVRVGPRTVLGSSFDESVEDRPASPTDGAGRSTSSKHVWCTFTTDL
ncbi:hypothetical protein CHUAL_003414 [Chamberlinius hualienensis]